MSAIRTVASAALMAAVLALMAVVGPAHAASGPLLLVKSNDLAIIQAQAAKDGVTLSPFTWTGCGGKSDPLKCQPGQAPIETAEGAVWALARRHYAGPVVFDPETWNLTPAAERADPLKWIKRAGQAAVSDPAMRLIVTPFFACRVHLPAPRVEPVPHCTSAKAIAFMIREAVTAARYGAYAVDIQSQWADSRPYAVFRPFVTADVKAIRAVSRKVIILAGVATNGPLGGLRVATLVSDYRYAVAAGVNGTWINSAQWMPTRCTAAQGGPGCPEIAVQLLKAIGLAS